MNYEEFIIYRHWHAGRIQRAVGGVHCLGYRRAHGSKHRDHRGIYGGVFGSQLRAAAVFQLDA